jgi:hypothetical protein
MRPKTIFLGLLISLLSISPLSTEDGSLKIREVNDGRDRWE